MRSEFIARYLDPLLPDVSVVEDFHRVLVEYVRRPDAVFLVRAVTAMERGVPVSTRDGTTLMPTDNAPAWWWHSVLFNDVRVGADRLPTFINATPTRMFEVPRTPNVNGAGWHVAHVLNAKDGDTGWPAWPRSSAVRRFLRNIHPCNVFYVPATQWQRVGSDPELIANVAAHYRRRYASIWSEFVQLAGGPPDLGASTADGVLSITSTEPIPAVTREAPQKPRQPTASVFAGGGDAWAYTLDVDHAPPVGVLLASHPDAVRLTAQLLSRLTVQRLVAIADAIWNRCRVEDMKAAAPGNPQQQAELAWSALMVGADKVHVRPSGWTGTVKLLAEGHLEGLAAVSMMDISTLAGACHRLVRGPYNQAVRSATR